MYMNFTNKAKGILWPHLNQNKTLEKSYKERRSLVTGLSKIFPRNTLRQHYLINLKSLIEKKTHNRELKLTLNLMIPMLSQDTEYQIFNEKTKIKRSKKWNQILIQEQF